MTLWVGAAWDKVCKKPSAMWRYFEKMGALMSTDGFGDDKIKPTKLPEGVVSCTFVDAVADARERAEGKALQQTALQQA